MTSHAPIRVGIVGSGPSAFYTVQALLRHEGKSFLIDVLERLPVPFGLLRFGVAPDHPRIKALAAKYDALARDPRVRFLGNVALGRDFDVEDLLSCYDLVVYAFGATSDRRLGIDGEDLGQVFSSTAFVGWYNGHPDFVSLAPDLTATKRVVIVGNGNVAVDIARVLSQPVETLHPTDIARPALAALRASAIEEVVLLGRRGPAQAAFSPKELRDLTEIPAVSIVIDPSELAADAATEQWMAADPKGSRSAPRILEILEGLPSVPQPGHRTIRLRFRAAPERILGEGRVHTVEVRENDLQWKDGAVVATPTDRTTSEPADLVIRAVGYKGAALPGVPHDPRTGIVPNDLGRVLEAPGGRVRPREYVVGWAKRGATGLIGTNAPDADETAQAMIADAVIEPDRPPIDALLAKRSVRVVSYDDWLRIDREELSRGEALGCAREKLLTVDAMLQVLS